MAPYFWLTMAWLFATLYLPLFLAAWCYRKWCRCRSKWGRRISCMGFWGLLLWLLGWYLQWAYVTFVWYMWDATGKYRGF